MMTTPTLSIITPVLNGGAFLPKAIRSVAEAAAMGADVEHIIADGGSTDGTLEIARAAMAEPGSPITQLLTGPDSGQSQAINRGVEKSKGRYVVWLNADDYYLPIGLSRMVGVLSSSNSEVVVGRCRFVDESGRTVFEPLPPDPVTPEALLRLLSGWFAGRSIVQPEAFILRDAFDAMGGIDETLHYTMDHHLWLRLANSGAAFQLEQIGVANQLAHADQKTADNAVVVAELLSYAFEQLEEIQPSIERDAAEQELRTIETRLNRARAMFEVLHRLTEFPSEKVLLVQTKHRLSEDEYTAIRAGLSRKSRILLAGLSPEDSQRLVRDVRPEVTPVVVGRVPIIRSAFDVVVATASAIGPNANEFVCTDLLRPGGNMYLIGAVAATDVKKVVQMQNKFISDSLTFRDSVLLDVPDAVQNIERLREMSRSVRSVRCEPGVQVVTLSRSVNEGNREAWPFAPGLVRIGL